MTITLITHDSVFGRFVAASLANAGAVDRVVIERRRASTRFLLRKLRRVGPVNFVFQYWLTREFEREGATILPDAALPPHAVIDDANAHLFDGNELVVAFGTSYLRKETLRRARHGILNLHTGFLPEYRGVKSEFWSLHNNDHAHLGWTLHYMTPELDAGDIVVRRRVRWTDETPGQMRARLLQDAMGVIPCALRAMQANASLGRAPQGHGTYYSAPTWREWRRFMRNRPAGTVAVGDG